jgi:hypothetical protein
MILRPLPEGMLLVFVPSLVALLMRAEQIRESELTRNEVFRLRDNCNVVVAIPQAVEEQRGYADLDMHDLRDSWLCSQGRRQ